MGDHGYNDVESLGFVAFSATLKQPAFKAHAPAGGLGEGASLLGVCYGVAEKAIDELIGSLNPENKNPQEFDGPFDSAQQRMRDGIRAYMHDPDEAKAHAARVLFSALLSGKSGTAQTRLTLAREVEFGRGQAELAAEEPYAGYITLLGLTDHVAAASAATEALATALGKSPDAVALIPRSVRQRAALAACRDAFQTIHALIAQARPLADAALTAELDVWLAALHAIPRT